MCRSSPQGYPVIRLWNDQKPSTCHGIYTRSLTRCHAYYTRLASLRLLWHLTLSYTRNQTTLQEARTSRNCFIRSSWTEITHAEHHYGNLRTEFSNNHLFPCNYLICFLCVPLCIRVVDISSCWECRIRLPLPTEVLKRVSILRLPSSLSDVNNALFLNFFIGTFEGFLQFSSFSHFVKLSWSWRIHTMGCAYVRTSKTARGNHLYLDITGKVNFNYADVVGEISAKNKSTSSSVMNP